MRSGTRRTEDWGQWCGALVLGALDRGEDLRLGLVAADPVGALDRLARLEVLVGLEEVLDLQAVELRHVGDVHAGATSAGRWPAR